MDGTGIQATFFLSPQSPQAHSIDLLLVVVLALACLVASVVTALVVWCILRYRDKGGGAPPQNEGNRRVEIIYTLIPLGIMIGLFVFTAITMARAEPATDKPPNLLVVAHQWWWEVRYPDDGVITANEIHLPSGVPMRLQLSSADVIHELWVPQLSPKMDAVPGQDNHLVFEGDQPGIYAGACAEFCGAQHARMRIRVIVEPLEDFRRWEHNQHLPSRAATDSSAAGRNLFFSESCIQCHAIQGTSARGDAGPDLTHVASRATLASCALENTPSNLRMWLADPQAIKPGCHMPNMKLSDADLDQLLSYLESLK